MEFALGQEFLVPRTVLIDELRRAIGQGKIVCITSDTYYARAQFDALLAAQGIDVCIPRHVP